MDDRGLRDIERWRDKIEVRLDNRQVFFLFFGSALVACMLFVLGVIVGKRLESRGRAVSPEIEDPLALLDKVATSPRSAQSPVTFPQALFGAAAKNGASDKRGNKSLSPVPVSPGAEKGKAVTPAPSPAAKPAEPNPKLAAMSVTEADEAKTKAGKQPAAAKPTEKAAEPVAEKSGAKAEDAPPAPPVDAKPAAIPIVAAAPDSKGRGRFALQLSSFQDKGEAEAFAKKFKSEKPYMVVSEIPGKGTWYRVRVGDFGSAKDALAAKQSFERKHNVIAYVAQR